MIDLYIARSLRLLLALASSCFCFGAGAAVTNVSIVNFTFSPANVAIRVNDQVIWANADAAVHTSTSATSLWNSGALSTGGKFTNTFKTAGSFPYLCAVHPF